MTALTRPVRVKRPFPPGVCCMNRTQHLWEYVHAGNAQYAELARVKWVDRRAAVYSKS